ncbi:hypothetical protein ACUN7Z_00675 [Vreelandella venusta]|uniref:hypothetical protein n=1 Tax=Vreelandella venusta TaxID=44935 RepID=UPI004043BC30
MGNETSRLVVEVDEQSIIREYRERLAALIEEWAAKGDPLPASELYKLADEVRHLTSS